MKIKTFDCLQHIIMNMFIKDITILLNVNVVLIEYFKN